MSNDKNQDEDAAPKTTIDDAISAAIQVIAVAIAIAIILAAIHFWG